MPKVTVAIPAFNVAPYLADCLHSVLSQHYDSFEVLVLDDGSTDATWEVANQFSGDARVRLFRSAKNRGVARTRNSLLQHARGKYIAPLDADDLMTGQRLRELASFLDRHPDIGVACGRFHWV